MIAAELAPMVRSELDALGILECSEQVCIVSIPRGKRSKMLYGFDQSELIAGALSRQMGIPYVNIIGRTRRGREQKGLVRDKRFGNVKGAFELKEDVALSGKYILLFDDIVTTGASMSGCVSLLQKAGAKEILALCIAQDYPKQKKRKEG